MLLGAEKENVAEGGLYENIKIHNEKPIVNNEVREVKEVKEVITPFGR